MSENFQTILRLTKERQRLWSKASHGGLSTQEIDRLHQATAELADTWDSYRREIAAGRRGADGQTLPLKRAA